MRHPEVSGIRVGHAPAGEGPAENIICLVDQIGRRMHDAGRGNLEIIEDADDLGKRDILLGSEAQNLPIVAAACGQPCPYRQPGRGGGLEREVKTGRMIHHLQQDQVAPFLAQQRGKFLEGVGHFRLGRRASAIGRTGAGLHRRHM